MEREEMGKERRRAYPRPNAHIEARSSSIKRQEKTRDMISRAVKASSQPASPQRFSHLKRSIMKASCYQLSCNQ
jgi:hypothetical protein